MNGAQLSSCSLFGLWTTPYQFFIVSDAPARPWSLSTEQETSAVSSVASTRSKREADGPHSTSRSSKSSLVPKTRTPRPRSSA